MSFIDWLLLLLALTILIVVGNYIHHKRTESRFENDDELVSDETEDIYHQTQTFHDLRQIREFNPN